MAPKKITFENRTEVPVIFEREFNSCLDEFTVKPQEKKVFSAEVYQTFETFWLLDSANKRTRHRFSADDLDDFTGAIVTKEPDGTYLLTKVPRSHTNLIASLPRIVRQFSKLFTPGKEEKEILPTRQSGSGSRSPQ